MNPSRVGAIVLRQFYLYRGSPQRILPIFAWVAVDILLWGFVSRYLNGVAHCRIQFRAGAVGSGVAVGLPDPGHAGRDHGVFRGRLVTQLPQSVRLAAGHLGIPRRPDRDRGWPPASSACWSCWGVAWAAFGLSFLVYGVALAPFMMVLFLTGIALGVAAIAIVLRFGPASEWLVWPIPLAHFAIRRVFYPVSVLPGWMQVASKALPPSYVFEGMRRRGGG